MPKKYAQYIILCEDLQTQVFARQYLLARGIPYQKIRTRPLSLGESGAGDAYVRKTYPIEVRALRQNPKLDFQLVVFIDADNHSLRDRHQQLAASLRESNEAERAPRERIAIFTPKRNIETWVHYLAGATVDEETTYSKRRKREHDCAADVHRLATQICLQGLPTDGPPSLHAACDEIARIL
jgi:hypothetical protein